MRDFRATLDSLIPFVRGYSMRREPFNKWYRFPRRQEDIKLCIDEWNIWNSTPRGEDNRYGVKMIYTWKDALWTACTMNTFVLHAEDIGITNLAQMVNVLGPIMTDGDASYVQPTYHVLKLYRDYLAGRRVDCLFEAPMMDAGRAGMLPVIDCAASLAGDGSIRLFVTNISRSSAYDLVLPKGYAMEKAICLSADSFDASSAVGREAVRKSERPASEALHIAPGTVNLMILK